jgi:hypothetical protein
MGPIRFGEWTPPFSIVVLGSLAGLLLGVMLFSLGRAVEKGPPGFTFAILNSATVMPGLIMSMLFGASLGFVYNFWHAAGSILVLAGLFWGAKGLQAMKEMRVWFTFSLLMLVFHVLLLTLFQWRGMLTQHPEAGLYLFSAEALKSAWFTPFMFLACGLVQTAIYLKSGSWKMKGGEIFYGTAGGISNLLCTLLLIRATEMAGPLENAIIFPIYSVVGIVLTNLWGQKLYQEQVNWRACQLCVFGLIVGTVDWKAVAAAIGF